MYWVIYPFNIPCFLLTLLNCVSGGKKHEREKENLSSLTSLLPFMKSMTGDLLIRDFSLSEERMFKQVQSYRGGV